MSCGFHRVIGEEIVRDPIIAANSITFAEGSPVYINSSGFLDLAAAGTLIYGFCTEAKVTTSDNQTVAQYKPRVISGENVMWWCDGDEAFAQTDVGQYCDLGTVTAGVPVMNLPGGASGQMLLVMLLSDQDPSAEGDTDRCVFTVAETQDYAYAQA